MEVVTVTVMECIDINHIISSAPLVFPLYIRQRWNHCFILARVQLGLTTNQTKQSQERDSFYGGIKVD